MNIAVSFPDQPAPHGGGTAPARAVDECAVKKHMVEPPAFEMTVS